MERNETTYKTRHRVNFSVSVKGIVTPEVTCEKIDSTKEDVMEEAHNLLKMALKVAEERSKPQ